MTKKKEEAPQLLVWMDLEMTGLDAEVDFIIEMATLITDRELNVVAEGPEIVIQRSAELFDKMDSWNREHHTKSGLWKKVVSSQIDERAAEEETFSFIRKHVGERKSPLCGNSVWQDRRFLARYMQKIDRYLHYRLIDVSTIKILGSIWYPADMAKKPEKQGSHRALDDIKESIEELKVYRELLFKKS